MFVCVLEQDVNIISLVESCHGESKNDHKSGFGIFLIFLKLVKSTRLITI